MISAHVEALIALPDQTAVGDCERDQGEENTRRGGAGLRGIQVDSGNYQAACSRVCDPAIFIMSLVLFCRVLIQSTMPKSVIQVADFAI